jgi:hypothetical protein
MITYENNGQVALISNVSETGYIVSVFASYNAFKTAQAPVNDIIFNGPVNYVYLDNYFNGWNKVCRNDAGQIVQCGPTPLPEVPESISARQIRLWLISNGVTLAQIDELINNIEDETQREYTRVEWEYAPYVERNHPMVAVFAQALGLSDEDIDNGFITAITL